MFIPLVLTANPLRVQVNGCKENIPYEDIVWLCSDRNYTIIQLINGRTIVSSKNLGYHHQHFPPDFVRVNRSYVVNIIYIHSWNWHAPTCLLVTGLVIKIALRRKRYLAQSIGNQLN